MSHFTTEEWADFARGATSEEQKVAMQQHLDNGCKECRRLLEILKIGAALAARDRSYEPPAYVVQYVKNAYFLRGTVRGAQWWKNVARLVFDSFAQPHPVGVRNSGPAPRHLLFKSGSFLLDLRLEPQPKSRQVCLVGQVLDSARPIKEFQPMPIVLKSQNATVTGTTSNTFGEFQLEFEMSENLVLVLGGKQEIVVPMSDLEPTRPSIDRLS